MRINFYICWGNRDKYFDWRLQTVKFNTKHSSMLQHLYLNFIIPSSWQDLKWKVKDPFSYIIWFSLFRGQQQNIANANWITKIFSDKDICPKICWCPVWVRTVEIVKWFLGKNKNTPTFHSNKKNLKEIRYYRYLTYMHMTFVMFGIPNWSWMYGN